MPLESATFVNDLVITNPVGATDERRFGDDHIRLIKTALRNTFPDGSAALRPSHVLLNTLTGSAAQYAFTGLGAVDGRFKSFEFDIVGVLPVTDGAEFRVLVSTDNGSSYASSGYVHSRFGFTNGGSLAGSGAGPTSEIVLLSGAGNEAANVEHIYGKVQLWIEAAATLQWNLQFVGAGSGPSIVSGMGRHGAGVNAVKFQFSSGNIAAGTVRCYVRI